MEAHVLDGHGGRGNWREAGEAGRGQMAPWRSRVGSNWAGQVSKRTIQGFKRDGVTSSGFLFRVSELVVKEIIYPETCLNR